MGTVGGLDRYGAPFRLSPDRTRVVVSLADGKQVDLWVIDVERGVDPRLLASVLTRELAREGRLTQLGIDLVDRPGALGKVANILGEAGANIVEVTHQRVFSDLPAKAALLEVVIETRDRAHLQETVSRLKAAGFEVAVRSNPGGTR